MNGHYCIVLYLYIYIVLLAVHTNQKRFQCERPRKKILLRWKKLHCYNSAFLILTGGSLALLFLFIVLIYGFMPKIFSIGQAAKGSAKNILQQKGPQPKKFWNH